MTRDQISNVVLGPLEGFPQKKALGEMYLGHIFSGIDMIAGLGVRLSVHIGDNDTEQFVPTRVEHELFPGGMEVSDQEMLNKMVKQGWKKENTGQLDLLEESENAVEEGQVE